MRLPADYDRLVFSSRSHSSASLRSPIRTLSVTAPLPQRIASESAGRGQKNSRTEVETRRPYSVLASATFFAGIYASSVPTRALESDRFVALTLSSTCSIGRASILNRNGDARFRRLRPRLGDE